MNQVSVMAEVRVTSPEKYVTSKEKRAYTSGERRLILNVYGILRLENPEMSKRDVAERVGVLTGSSRATVERIRREASDGPPLTPGKKRPYQEGTRTRMARLDDFQKNNIKRKVHSILRQNIPPTVHKVCEMINEDPDLPDMSESTTRRLLLDLDFKFEKRQRQSMLIERNDIVLWRRKYLTAIARHREEGRKIFYLDETWCNAGHSTKKAWTPSYIKSARQAFMEGETTGLRNIPGRGGRHIVVHIGSQDGFLKDPNNPSGTEDARWVFRAKKTAKMDNATHHDEMNSAAFEDWFSGILHLLPPDSVIVMDNASYHSQTTQKIPKISWKKCEIQKWLNENGVIFNPKLVKAELIELIPPHLKAKANVYKIDRMAEENGHTVLRLPPYHCELNPIELVWAQVKNKVAMTNADYTMSSVEVLLHDALNKVTAEDWKKSVDHVRKVEEAMWELDAISDDIQDRVIVMDAGNDVDTDTEGEDWVDGCEDSYDDLALPL